MNKLYNKEMDIAIGLNDFFSHIDFKFSKPQIKIIPHIISSIVNAENITTLDISKCFIDDSFLTNQSSIENKLWRFFNNLNLMVLLFSIVLLNILLIIIKPSSKIN